MTDAPRTMETWATLHRAHAAAARTSSSGLRSGDRTRQDTAKAATHAAARSRGPSPMSPE